MSIKLIMPDMATKLEKTKRKLNKKIVKALVEMIPDNIEYLTWDQYTPYFNDGDTCRFYVCEASFVAANGDEYGQYGDKHDYDNILRDIDIITDDDNKDIMILAFGDHATVKVYKDGRCTVEECDHE